VARKLAVLCWHLLTKDADDQWARPAPVHNIRAMQLQAGQPEKKGNKRGAAYAYNIKALHDREIDVVRHAEHAYEQFVGRWQPRGLGKRRRVPPMRSDDDGCAAGLTSSSPTLCHAVTRAPPE
jgi:transposase